MGFFDALRRVMNGQDGPTDTALVKAWGLSEEEAKVPAEDTTAYDRAQWQRRLKRMVGELPGSKEDWADLIADGKALGFEHRHWLGEKFREEFRLLIRKAVSDRKFTESEHRNIDLARDLMGIPEDEAEAILHEVVAEAEKFFGKKIEGA